MPTKPNPLDDKDHIYEHMVNLIERLNYAFYVEGSAKAMRPLMAETKELLRKARPHIGLAPISWEKK